MMENLVIQILIYKHPITTPVILLVHLEATELCTTHQKVQVWHQHEVKKTVSPTCRVQVSTFPQANKCKEYSYYSGPPILGPRD